ncbi:MAG: tRNA (adenosine(37)-N6)-dimethylallyltransferase MiaA [Crocinitomicaceae bacterium]|nr:tRNA (adenosine(37)-N6)-dimethylallyltransferase MiaA [Crocinitomicaceae bacterium]
MERLITILGPTATGKTNVATHLAQKINGEIISADSRQVFQHMDIGTGKDLNEYQIEDTFIPYHLIDIKKPGEEYSLFEFLKDYKKAFQLIKSNNKEAIMCGGTTLYLNALLQSYSFVEIPDNYELPEQFLNKNLEELVQELAKRQALHNTTDTSDKARALKALREAIYIEENPSQTMQLPKVRHLVFGISLERDEIKKRITQRLKERLQNGMIEEAEILLEMGLSFEDLKYYGLEYKYLALFLEGKINRNDLFQKLNSAIHEFAKKQMTRYRKMEKEGIEIKWIDGRLPTDDKVQLILDNL